MNPVPAPLSPAGPWILIITTLGRTRLAMPATEVGARFAAPVLLLLVDEPPPRSTPPARLSSLVASTPMPAPIAPATRAITRPSTMSMPVPGGRRVRTGRTGLLGRRDPRGRQDRQVPRDRRGGHGRRRVPGRSSAAARPDR